MPHPGIHVLRRVKRIGNIERPRGRRHQLHQSHRAFSRHRIGIEIRFHLDHRAHQARIHVVPRRRLLNRGVDILLRKCAVKSLIGLHSAVEVRVDLRSRRARRPHHRSAGRNRLETMFGRTPINQRRPCRRCSPRPRSRGRPIPASHIPVNIDLAAGFVRSGSNRSHPHARLSPRRHRGKQNGKKGGRG